MLEDSRTLLVEEIQCLEEEIKFRDERKEGMVIGFQCDLETLADPMD